MFKDHCWRLEKPCQQIILWYFKSTFLPFYYETAKILCLSQFAFRRLNNNDDNNHYKYRSLYIARLHVKCYIVCFTSWSNTFYISRKLSKGYRDDNTMAFFSLKVANFLVTLIVSKELRKRDLNIYQYFENTV